MGTVIAYDCLERVPDCPPIDALFTLGSPLGIDEVRDLLQPGWTPATPTSLGWSSVDSFPSAKLNGPWYNDFDRLDPVAATAPSLASYYMKGGLPLVHDAAVNNGGWWRHDLNKYFARSELREETAPGRARPLRRRNHVVSGITNAPNAVALPPSDLRRALAKAAEALDTDQVTALCGALVARLSAPSPSSPDRGSPEGLADPPRQLCNTSATWRRSPGRADRLGSDRLSGPPPRSRKAQIDQGKLEEAVETLNALVVDSAGHDEYSEAEGLLGRAYKQRFVALKTIDRGAAARLAAQGGGRL